MSCFLNHHQTDAKWQHFQIGARLAEMAWQALPTSREARDCGRNYSAGSPTPSSPHPPRPRRPKPMPPARGARRCTSTPKTPPCSCAASRSPSRKPPSRIRRHVACRPVTSRTLWRIKANHTWRFRCDDIHPKEIYPTRKGHKVSGAEDDSARPIADDSENSRARLGSRPGLSAALR